VVGCCDLDYHKCHHSDLDCRSSWGSSVLASEAGRSC
jgi:hypothetical protein